jgi:hypothetical protein
MNELRAACTEQKADPMNATRSVVAKLFVAAGLIVVAGLGTAWFVFFRGRG